MQLIQNINVLLYIFLLGIMRESVCEDNLKQYLSDRLEIITSVLDNHTISTRGAKNGVEVIDEKTVTVPDVLKNLVTYSTFNETFLLNDYEIFKFKPLDNTIEYITSSMITQTDDYIAFIKTIEHNNEGMMFVAYNSKISMIYGYSNHSNDHYVIQTILNHNYVTDAKFFLNNGSLYLAVSHMYGVSLVPFVIYKWMGTHFDQVAEELIPGSIQVESFKYGDSEIIVILRNIGIQKSNSYVYEFKKDKLRKIQILDNYTPGKMKLFLRQENIYLIVTDEKQRSVLYIWSKTELVPINYFQSSAGVSKIMQIEEAEYSIIFIIYKDKLTVYTLYLNELNHVTTHLFQRKFEQILEVLLPSSQNEELKTMLILGFNSESNLIISRITFMANEMTTVGDTLRNNDLIDCMDELESTLQDSVDGIKTLEYRAKNVLKTNQPLEYNGRFNVAAPVVAQIANIHNPGDADIDEISSQIREIEDRIEQLTSAVINYLNNDTLVIDQKLEIMGALNAFNLKSRKMQVMKLNGVNWNPQQWLSYSNKQSISTTLTIKKMFVAELTHHANDLFTDVFVKSGSQKIMAPVACESLKAFNMYTESINSIPVHKMYVRSQPKVVTGEKVFNNIIATNANIDLLNKKNMSQIIKLFTDPKGNKYEFPPSIKINNLIVEKINNVDWNEFTNSVFKIGISRVIEGNLNFNKLRTNSLTTNMLSGNLVENLLTVSSNQVINSSISFGSVHAKEVDCNMINGIRFPEDVAYFNNDANVVISGPVTLKSGKVRGDLNKTGNFDWNVTEGYNDAQLLQIYNSKVKIAGDLYIRNANILQTAKVFVNGNEMNEGIFNEYWRKTINQEIPTNFEATMGITTPHLSTKYLNSIPIDNYMINNLDDKLPSKYIFQNATVVGNIIINKDSLHTPDLEKLSKNSIRTNGTFTIRGAKNFSGKLSVDNLKTDSINSVSISNIYTIYSKKLPEQAKYETLILNENVETSEMSIKTINGIDLEKLYETTLFINEPIEAENMDFTHATAENLLTTKINNKLFSEYQASRSKLYSLNNINLLKIRGNASVNNLKNVDYINDVNVRNKIKKFQEGNPYDQVDGNVIFEGKVQVKNLLMKNINEIDFTALLPRILNVNSPQNIPAKHAFKVIRTENLITPMVNDVDMMNLLDTQSEEPQEISVKMLKLSKPYFATSLFTNYLVCDFVNAFKKLHNLPVRYWKNVVISGDAAFMNTESGIGNLVSNSVRNNKENVIQSLINLNHIYAEQIIAKRLINGIHLENLMEDALLRNGGEQVVTGFKIFNNIKTSAANILENVEIPMLNRFDILKINNTTSNKQNINNMIIRGRKTFFGGLQVDQILTPSAAGILSENLVSLKNLQMIPSATFDTLVLQDNLNINYSNGLNFNEFINNRLLLNTPEVQILSATCFFDEIELHGPVTITTFNGINVDDIVFDEGVQIITGSKKWKHNVNVFGDVVIENMNGFLIDEVYNNAIMLTENADIKSNICLKNTSQVNGNIIADEINHVSLALLKDQLETQNGQIRANIAMETIKGIQTLIDENMVIIQRLPDQYLYLEKSDKIHIEVPNSIDANIANIKNNNLMIHIQTEDSGEYCGLPTGCSCPNQYTFVVSPGYSVNQIDNKYGQRVFSYEDQDVTIHVVANSWSSSNNCRTNASAIYEFTTLTWTAQAGININQTIFPEKITGYVSDVQFFAYSRQIFAVIGRFYDPVINTHNMETLVFRFCKITGTINEVQRIPTIAAWKLHTFNTAQGITLVIGNRETNPNVINIEDTIDIYRFNPQTYLFELLRNIPSTGCLSITSLVFGYESLIIIAQVNSPMEILKYDHTYNNYHFYQNMLQTYPVISVSSFYTGGVGKSDANLLAVGDNDELYVFSYQFLSGWKLESESKIEGLRNVVPFTFNSNPYVLVASINGSSVLTVVKHGHN